MKTVLKTLVILLFLSQLSCTNRNEINKKIIGEWYFEKIDFNNLKDSNQLIPPPIFTYRFFKGITFFENGICEAKPGFFKKFTTIANSEIEKIYLGSKTKYKIKKDSVLILDLSDNLWKGIEVFSVDENTLTLRTNENVFFKYVKFKALKDTTNRFEKIIISSSGCYGTCPISNTFIDKEGGVLFYGERFNSRNGFYSSTISKKQFLEIEKNFLKTDVPKLNRNYEANWTDDETVTVTFIKDGKIFKTIKDYGGKSPSDFLCAYTPVRYLYQKLKLTTLEVDIPTYPLTEIRFLGENKPIDLSKSETFFLNTELLKGKKVYSEFKKNYKIQYWDENDKREFIYTDGRFYSFFRNGRKEVIDIGYNFLDRNGHK